MDQRLSFITIGTSHFETMKDFYTQQFGWTPLKEMDNLAFFKLNGFILGLFPASELAEDIGIDGEGQGFRKFTLAINYRSTEEVDAVFAACREKNITIVKEPQPVFWGGYSGYIADPENNYWEIAFNPFLELDAEGNVVTHS